MSLAVERIGEEYEGNPTAIVDVTVIDIMSGTAIPHRSVVVRYGKIDHIKPAAEFTTPGWMTELDGTGRFLIPGLWDAHTHLSFWGMPDSDDTTGIQPDPEAYRDVLERLAAWGVTTVRDMGGDLDAIDSWREKMAHDEVIGPTVIRAGPYVDGPKENHRFRSFVTNAEEVREAVRSLADRNVDFIKIHSQVPPDALSALAQEAATRNLSFAGHVPYGTTIDELVDAGIMSIEHVDAPFISRLGSRQGSLEEWKSAYEWHKTAAGAALFKKMAENQVAFTPTLGIFDTGWEGVGEPWSALRYWYREMATLAHENGVPLLAGTDFARKAGPVHPGIGLHEELVHLVDVGLTPAEALRAATMNPATMLGREDSVGRIEPGLVADLVLLSGNPLIDIRQTQRVEAVFLRGRLLDSEQLTLLRNDSPPR